MSKKQHRSDFFPFCYSNLWLNPPLNFQKKEFISNMLMFTYPPPPENETLHVFTIFNGPMEQFVTKLSVAMHSPGSSVIKVMCYSESSHLSLSLQSNCLSLDELCSDQLVLNVGLHYLYKHLYWHFEKWVTYTRKCLFFELLVGLKLEEN